MFKFNHFLSQQMWNRTAHVSGSRVFSYVRILPGDTDAEVVINFRDQVDTNI